MSTSQKKTSQTESKGEKQKRGPGIGPLLNEVLFKLWMTGKTPSELIALYEGTAEEFSNSSLHRAIHQYSWHERREAILTRVRDGVDDDIENTMVEKLRTVHQIISLTSDQIQREYVEFLRNPNDRSKRPSWLPNNIKEVDVLYRLHDFLASGGVNKHDVNVRKAADSMVSMPDNVALSVLKMLSEVSTKELAAKSSSVVTAEFEEAVEDDEAEQAELLRKLGEESTGD